MPLQPYDMALSNHPMMSAVCHPVRGLVTTQLTRLTGPDETVLAGHARVGLAPAPTDKPVTKQLNI